jgi:uncharacterized protein (TIGR02598 family)
MKTSSLRNARLAHRDIASRHRLGARLHQGGFTLVEVTLAIGIISFAFVTMFGLLPVGLNVSRQAMDTTIEAQIVQKMKTQALQTDFSMLSNLKDADELSFDDQGKQVEAGKGNFRAGYSSVSTETALPDGSITRQLKTVTISVRNTKGGVEVANSQPKKFTILIPNNGL